VHLITRRSRVRIPPPLYAKALETPLSPALRELSGVLGRCARGRVRGSGTRALQALELVKSQPGVTVAEIASAMGIKQNYLYRVLPALEKDHTIVKRDKGRHSVES
jgi:transcription initiation factor IIE alpha subunit